MSDRAVAEALDDMEAALGAATVPTPEALAQWRLRFDAAVTTAERGPGWDGLVVRAQELSERLRHLSLALAERRDEVRRELEHQAAGNRALKSYSATTLP